MLSLVTHISGGRPGVPIHKDMQFCIPGGAADKIVQAMKSLLAARRELLVTRLRFVRSWARLRRMLEQTPDYRAFRAAVISRAGGACEECAEVGHHVHHLKPVAFEPDLVMVLSNGQFLCFKCHRGADKEARRQALRNPEAHRNPSRSPKPDTNSYPPRQVGREGARSRTPNHEACR